MIDRVRARLERFGRFWRLTWDVVDKSLLSPGKGLRQNLYDIVHQVHRMGVRSLPVVALIAVFLGMILSLQTAYQLEKFGATIYVSSLVSVSVLRELGPLLTAILIAGRIGAGITAELGSMVVSDEVTALDTMAIDPTEFLLVPRQVALVIALPILTLAANLLAIVGGMGISWLYIGIPVGQYYHVAMEALVMRDLLVGLTKSVMFAGLIATISCYKGFAVTGGARSVGRATTDTVVLSIVYIILADLLFTVLFYLL